MTDSTRQGSPSLAEIDRTMGETVAAVEAKKGIARRLERCRQELDMERKRLSELQAIMDREEEDVARLEGLGLANLFYTILGDKPAKVDKERQEFLIAKLRRDEAAASVKALQNDIEALASELAKAGRPEDDLRKLMEAKGRLLRERGGPQAEALLELDEKKGRLEAERKEILEALEAGRKVLAGLEEVLRSLESAQGWGVWDMIGGGLLATAAKHSYLDKARDQVHEVQSLMRRFRRELADIGSFTEDASIGGFERFADYFFDGLFVDWMVQSKINTSVDRTREQLARVRSLIGSLEARDRSLRARSAALAQERERLLLGK
jgi:DNA repair exonuclease SbcCD ATPase subunit